VRRSHVAVAHRGWRAGIAQSSMRATNAVRGTKISELHAQGEIFSSRKSFATGKRLASGPAVPDDRLLPRSLKLLTTLRALAEPECVRWRGVAVLLFP